MGQGCSTMRCCAVDDGYKDGDEDCFPDPVMSDLMQQSILATEVIRENVTRRSGITEEVHPHHPPSPDDTGQTHLLYKNSYTYNPPIGQSSIKGNVVHIQSTFRRGNHRRIAESYELEIHEKHQNLSPRDLSTEQRRKSSHRPPMVDPLSNDLEGAILERILLKCPTKLLIRRRPLSMNKSETGNMVLLEGEDYRRDKDYFSRAKTSSNLRENNGNEFEDNKEVEETSDHNRKTSREDDITKRSKKAPSKNTDSSKTQVPNPLMHVYALRYPVIDGDEEKESMDGEIDHKSSSSHNDSECVVELTQDLTEQELEKWHEGKPRNDPDLLTPHTSPKSCRPTNENIQMKSMTLDQTMEENALTTPVSLLSNEKQRPRQGNRKNRIPQKTPYQNSMNQICHLSKQSKRTSSTGQMIFQPSRMEAPPEREVLQWVTVSEEHRIYVVDVGMSPSQCDKIVMTAEQVCKGQYAAYTYAKQTLGCKEHLSLAEATFGPVHAMVRGILDELDAPLRDTINARLESGSICDLVLTNENDGNVDGGVDQDLMKSTDSNSTSDNLESRNTSGKSSSDSKNLEPSAKAPMKSQPPNATRLNVSAKKKEGILELDDREPHIVKYDVTKMERQKLDMHTDKSEWTFLIALSNGCGIDYDGGGTYFECLEATVHIQKGHALVFPGKLKHCGIKITSGLRFLLVGFLVDKSPSGKDETSSSLKNEKTILPKQDGRVHLNKAALGCESDSEAQTSARMVAAC